MDVTQAPPPAFDASSATAQPDTAGTQISSDFQTFLRMLTVQLQNQDPLNPVESQDFAVQLATFSTVEQAVVTNDLLRDLTAQMGGTAIQQLGNWVGMEALARTPTRFDGAPVTIRPDFAEGADAATLVVRNADGEVVQRLPLDMEQDSFTWAGVDADGAPFPPGTYRFDVESFAEDSLLGAQIAATYNRIEEARTDGSDVLLRLSDGSEIASSLVTGLRTPAPSGV